jgi:hypothetical protein
MQACSCALLLDPTILYLVAIQLDSIDIPNTVKHSRDLNSLLIKQTVVRETALPAFSGRCMLEFWTRPWQQLPSGDETLKSALERS